MSVLFASILASSFVSSMPYQRGAGAAQRPQATGATMSQVAEQFTKLSGEPTIVILPQVENLPWDPNADLETYSESLKKAGFSVLRSGFNIISKATLPTNRLGALQPFYPPIQAAAPVQFATIPATAIQEDRLTIQTQRSEVVRLSELTKLDTTRKLVIHPYYLMNDADFPMAIQAKGVEFNELCRSISRAIGGKFGVESKTYTVGFDAAAFKKNFSNVIQAIEQKMKLDRERLKGRADSNEVAAARVNARNQSLDQFSSALAVLVPAVLNMPNTQVEQTFAYAGSQSNLNLTQFAMLQQPLGQFLKLKMSQGNPDNPEIAQLTNQMGRLNEKNPGVLSVQTDFRMNASLNLRVQGSNRNERFVVPIL